MNLEIQTVKPVFGKNYDIGYVGFTYHDRNFVSEGIAWFTRWENLHDIPVSHALIVTGEDSCIEATGTGGGVRESPLRHYFDDPGVRISFRQPKGWDAALGNRIAASARLQLGRKYDYGVMVADMVVDSILGHFVDRIFGGRPGRALMGLLQSPDRFVCSELVAWAMEQQPEFAGQGILREKAAMVSPQGLFEDDRVFDAWKPPSA